MRVEWLQFLLLLELDIVVIGLVVLFIAWLVYHYTIRSGYATLTYQPTTMNETVLAKCTHIHNRYLGSPWLPSGDFLSILSTFFRSHPHPYRREQVKADDGAMLNLDWLEPADANETTPVLIVLPGITGHSKSGYLVHMVNGAYSHGWRVVVVVYPGTDLSKVSTARFIRSHVPHDLETTIEHIQKRLPRAVLYGCGYSMGAALLTKYLAHHGEASLLKAAISCSNPFDVLYSVTNLKRGYIKQLYNIHFLAALKKMYRNNEVVFREAFPHLTLDDVIGISSVEEYDTKLTMAHFGFSDLQEYYVSLGCTDSVSDVAVPMLVAHARDDPIVPSEAIPMDLLKNNPNIITMITNMGGHTGWLQGLNPMGPSWFDDVALEWLFHVHDHLLANPKPSVASKKHKVAAATTNLTVKSPKNATKANGPTKSDVKSTTKSPGKLMNSAAMSATAQYANGTSSSAKQANGISSAENGPSRRRIASPEPTRPERATKSPKATSTPKANGTPTSPKGRRARV